MGRFPAVALACLLGLLPAVGAAGSMGAGAANRAQALPAQGASVYIVAPSVEGFPHVSFVFPEAAPPLVETLNLRVEAPAAFMERSPIIVSPGHQLEAPHFVPSDDVRRPPAGAARVDSARLEESADIGAEPFRGLPETTQKVLVGVGNAAASLPANPIQHVSSYGQGVFTLGGSAQTEPSPVDVSAQKIIFPGDAIPPREEIGEKPFKILEMARAGFRIPKFFVVQTDGSGELAATPELARAFGRLKSPVIARSAHRDEGRTHSFSGVFVSFPNITELVQPPPDLTGLSEEEARERKGDWDFSEPTGLTRAYREMVQIARDGHASRQYREENKIADFNASNMNLIAMEQLDVEVFGMFVTSDQNDPNIVNVHYEVRKGKKDFRGRNPGGIVSYNKRTHRLEASKVDPETGRVLIEFAETAARIEKMYGLQQVELASSAGDVYVLQSRTINLANPADVPRFSHYESLAAEELRATGYGFFQNLPIIVVDSLKDSGDDPGNSAEYRRLEAEKRRLGGEDSSAADELYKTYSRLKAQAKQKRREELLLIRAQYPEYALVIKDAEALIDHELFAGKNYDFLNLLASKARVVIRGRDQRAIRHEDWDNVERGGVTIWPKESSDFMRRFTHRPAEDNSPSEWRWEIHTGERLNVLSNTDGVFVWRPATAIAK